MRKLRLILCSILLLSFSNAFAELTTGDFFLDVWLKAEYKIYYLSHNSKPLEEWNGTLVTLSDVNAMDFEIYDSNGYKKFYGRLINPSEIEIRDEKHIQSYTWEFKNRRGFAQIIWADNPDYYKTIMLVIGDDSYIFGYK